MLITFYLQCGGGRGVWVCICGDQRTTWVSPSTVWVSGLDSGCQPSGQVLFTDTACDYIHVCTVSSRCSISNSLLYLNLIFELGGEKLRESLNSLDEWLSWLKVLIKCIFFNSKKTCFQKLCFHDNLIYLLTMWHIKEQGGLVNPGLFHRALLHNYRLQKWSFNSGVIFLWFAFI